MENKLVVVAISRQANEVLGQIKHKVNKDFLGGMITKRDLASWVIANGETLLSESVIGDITYSLLEYPGNASSIRRG